MVKVANTTANENSGKYEQTTSLSIGGQGGALTVGRNKSGMPWKKSSKQSAFKSKKCISKSYEKRMEETKKMKAIQQRVAALREADRAKVNILNRVYFSHLPYIARKWNKLVALKKKSNAES